MQPVLAQLRRQLASIADFFVGGLVLLRPQAREVRSQRMCPFCGLITPRAKQFCLECGKSLRDSPVETKDAKQEG